MVAFEGLSSAKSDQAKIEGFRAVPTYEAGAEPQPRMRSFICWEADIVLVDTAGESDPFVHDWFLNIFESISDLKVICAQSWGHIEAPWDPRILKASSQKHYSWCLNASDSLYVWM